MSWAFMVTGRNKADAKALVQERVGPYGLPQVVADVLSARLDMFLDAEGRWLQVETYGHHDATGYLSISKTEVRVVQADVPKPPVPPIPAPEPVPVPIPVSNDLSGPTPASAAPDLMGGTPVPASDKVEDHA